MVNAQPSISSGKWDKHKLLWDLDIQTDHLISASRLDLIILKTKQTNKKKKKKRKKTSKIVDFSVSVDHRIKLKESEKKDKYLDFAIELKKNKTKLGSMKVKIIPIVIGAFGTVSKGLLKSLKDLEIRGRVETILTTALLIFARILRRVLKIWGDLLSRKL